MRQGQIEEKSLGNGEFVQQKDELKVTMNGGRKKIECEVEGLHLNSNIGLGLSLGVWKFLNFERESWKEIEWMEADEAENDNR